MHRRTILAGLAATGLGACADRHVFATLPQGETAGLTLPILAVTTREAPELGGAGSGRAPDPRFGRFVVSIPRDRAPGTLNRARFFEPDPEQHFLIAGHQPLENRAAFRAALREALDRQPEREAVIFVHGFNTSFTDAIYRHAQFVHDMNLPGVPIHFSWPSAGNAVAYNYDRDSMLYSRTALENLLRDTRAAGARDVVVVAHSMGSLLILESLRQMSIRDGGSPGQPLDGLVLIAPDVDLALFRQLVLEIGMLPQPFAIVLAANDPALLLSELLSGETSRLGTLRDPEALSGVGVTLIDVTDFTLTARNAHWTATTSPGLIRILTQLGPLDKALAQDERLRNALRPGQTVTLERPNTVILSPGLMTN